jgi:hypothetical protein
MLKADLLPGAHCLTTLSLTPGMIQKPPPGPSGDGLRFSQAYPQGPVRCCSDMVNRRLREMNLTQSCKTWPETLRRLKVQCEKMPTRAQGGLCKADEWQTCRALGRHPGRGQKGSIPTAACRCSETSFLPNPERTTASGAKAVLRRAAYAVARGAAALQSKGDLSGVVGLIVVHKSRNRHAQQSYGFLQREHRSQQIKRDGFQSAAALN